MLRQISIVHDVRPSLLPMSDRLAVACLTAPVGRGDAENLHLAGAGQFLLLKENSSEEPESLQSCDTRE
jgi:hypothetical protein